MFKYEVPAFGQHFTCRLILWTYGNFEDKDFVAAGNIHRSQNICSHNQIISTGQ